MQLKKSLPNQATITEPINRESCLKSISNEVIKSFFSDYRLEDSQYYLWNLFKLAFSGNHRGLTRLEKDNMATFYKELDDLLTAIYYNNKPIQQS